MEGIQEADKTKGLELRVQCPFCHGGDRHEFSFDVNVDRGVARCWRATCGWAGTGHRLYAEVMEITKREAYLILAGGEGTDQIISDFEAFDKLWMSTLWDAPDEVEDSFYERVAGSVELMDADENIIEEIREWIENRGYDFFKFIDTHHLLVPPQFMKWDGYVIFEYDTKGNKTYQGYKFKKELLGLDIRPDSEYKCPKTMAGSHRIKESVYRYDDLKPSGALIITEGIFDAARLLSYGFQATCVFNTTVSEIQAYLISQLPTKEIIIFFDYGADELAFKAAKLIAKYCETKETKVSIVSVRKVDADPDKLSEKEVMNILNKRRTLRKGDTDELLRKFDELAKLM
jgi:5S rRNA maturation endonuclease (ribonuclease M5)